MSEYCGIDMSEQLAALAGLGDPPRRGEVVARVLATPERWCPAVLMALASVVFADDAAHSSTALPTADVAARPVVGKSGSGP